MSKAISTKKQGETCLLKILVDNALSHRLAELLCLSGYDAVHLRDRIPVDSLDEEVFELAKSEGRIILSADTDFAAIVSVRSDKIRVRKLPIR